MLIYPYGEHKIHSFGYPSLFLNKHLPVTLIYSVAPASYPNVSLTMKVCAQTEAGDHQSLALRPGHSRVTRVPLAFRAHPCAKNEALKEAGAAQLQPSYPSPEPTFRPNRALGVNVDLGEG